MIPNYIIPSEYEMLEIISKNNGIAVVWNCNAKRLMEENKIQLLWNSNQMPSTEVFLLSGKIATNSPIYESLVVLIVLFGTLPIFIVHSSRIYYLIPKK